MREEQSTMRCTISSLVKSWPRVIYLSKQMNGELKLSFKTDGVLIQGGAIDPDGNLTEASQVLFRQFLRLGG